MINNRHSVMENVGCQGPYVGLTLTSLALLISVSLNILLYLLRRRERQCREVEEPLSDSFHGIRFEEDERLNQDNPIYGNICMDGGGTLSNYGYPENKTNEGARQNDKRQAQMEKPADISYASLDLSMAPQRKKKQKRKYQQNQNQMHEVQTHPPPMAQQNSVEMDIDCEVALPSRSSSLMVSRNSIYLNSHQVALETEELEREREMGRNSHREREMEMRNMYGDFDYSLVQSEPRCEQDS